INLLIALPSFASEVNSPTNPVLRILIDRGQQATSIRITAGAGARLTDSFDSFLAVGPASWTFRSSNNGVVAQTADGNVVATGPLLRVTPGSESLLTYSNRSRTVRF